MVSSGDVSLLLLQPLERADCKEKPMRRRLPPPDHVHHVISIPPLSDLDFQVLEPINQVPPCFLCLDQVDVGVFFVVFLGFFFCLFAFSRVTSRGIWRFPG